MCPDNTTNTNTQASEDSATQAESVVQTPSPQEGTQEIPQGGQGGPGVTRRKFVAGVGIVGMGAVFAGSIIRGFLLPDNMFAVPASGGYLLVDMKKCSGCSTCMMACSLGHTGKTGYSYSRLQVLQDTFGKFPDDITISQCLQCEEPACLDACPTSAIYADKATGVRMVDARKCIGCERCVEACPYEPVRMAWNSQDGVAMKCDLCKDTPYWGEEGGVNGKRACETYCPFHAIVFTSEMPEQTVEGYETDLRSAVDWNYYGFDGDKSAGELPTIGIGAAKLGYARLALRLEQQNE